MGNVPLVDEEKGAGAVVSFFTRQGDCFTATEIAVSRWSPTQLAGTAVCGLLARELEGHRPNDGFVPARLSVELFQPVLTEPISLKSEVVRAGNRVHVADAWIVQEGRIRVRASVLYLAVGEQPPGTVWQEMAPLPVPEQRLDDPAGSPPWFKCGDAEWSGDFAAAQNSERKAIWQNVPALVADEPLTPFQRAAFTGDATNLVCNWGDAGIGYINSDMTLTLSRLPIGPELGLQANSHIATAGIAVATATLYDRTGPLGTCVATGVSNARRQVDLAANRPPTAL